MFKPNTFVKATTSTLAACLLMACGASDDSTSNENLSPSEDIKYTLSLASSDNGNTGIIGKSIYSINVKDLDGIAVYGETPTLKPMMDMTSGMNHSAPHLGCTETDQLGASECTVYFPMASSMKNENEEVMIMGTWTVEVELANAVALSFSPNVTMPMVETSKAVLKGTSETGDTVGGIPRSYIILNTAPEMIMSTRSVELFIATKEGMNFPTLAISTTLSEDTADALSIDSINVLVSADKDAADEDWAAATPDSKGIWTANINGYTDAFYVKLSVNGDAKMTNGLDYATFSKTSSMSDMNH
jgi:hypothetical protein